jgi:hypothetical protein
MHLSKTYKLCYSITLVPLDEGFEVPDLLYNFRHESQFLRLYECLHEVGEYKSIPTFQRLRQMAKVHVNVLMSVSNKQKPCLDFHEDTSCGE